MTDAADLRSDIRGLTTAVDNLAQRYHRGRLVVAGLILVLVASLPLTGVLIAQNGRINRVQAQQIRTTRDALCPLYAMILSAYHPEAQPKATLAAYEKSFAVIRAGVGALGC